MKQTLTFIFGILLLQSSCNPKTTQKTETLEHWTDTLYTDKSDPNYYEWSIVISDSVNNKFPIFEMGQKQTIKVEVSGLERYPVILLNPKNVQITQQDSIQGTFNIIPSQSSFSFEVWQNFGENHVFQKFKLDTGFMVESMNGPALIGWTELRAR
ncbi:hypothetical protein [Roseivirga sp. E12]|uniref:hypothetical protein n=1 Tax=Roseivirga sp. E12 TaxID=2819237 RepID=UPI001ABC45A3|nr:hypothetical protein [Roseivirga sp. E12]MBO3700314.1 hypothetical protein [Roseivirga sp. E12]